MATLKEFEEALRQAGMVNALAILEGLKKRDREKRSIAPARRVVGRKMTAELARSILEMHATTGMTQQEIAFKLGVNQGRVNEVIKRGKWLNADPSAPEVLSRDRAMQRLDLRARARRVDTPAPPPSPLASKRDRVVRHDRPTPAPSARPVPPQRAGQSQTAELPLEGVRPSRAAAPDTARAPLRRPPEAAPGIVSAQLAFLDL